MALASVLSAHLDEPEAAGSLYPILRPYAGHIVAFTAPQPVVCLGSAAFYLGSAGGHDVQVGGGRRPLRGGDRRP